MPLALSTDQEAALAALLSDEWSSDAIFVTGPAGTGKSTVLREFRKSCKGNVAVVAPTGVAALNCGGQTIHRLFGLPTRTVRFRHGGDIKKRFGPMAKVLAEIDCLIIDEASMVRSDIMDAIDWSMRLHANEPNRPFGGKRVALFGDTMQLPPVVRDEDQELMRWDWEGPFFFDARVWSEAAMDVFDLTTIHRQASDTTLADALMQLRDDDSAGMAFMNALVAVPHSRADVLTVTPRRREADAINGVELAKIAGKPRTYQAVVTGDFSESDMPTEMSLTLKVGAQVIAVANGPSYVNGTLGTVTKMDDDSVTVRTSDGETICLEPREWDRIEFRFDNRYGRVEPAVVATFEQIPLRLAWAMTIHKAQGLTLDRVHVEVGSGFFSHGQAYVALSRVRTSGGLTLSKPIRDVHLLWDPRVQEFRQHIQRQRRWGRG